MRFQLLPLLAILMGVSQAVPVYDAPATFNGNRTEVHNATLTSPTPDLNQGNDTVTLNGTVSTLMERPFGKPFWPDSWDYKPTSNTRVKVLRFKGKRCAVPATLQHEDLIEIAPEGYEADPEMACKQFKKENAMQSLMFELPSKILKQGVEGDRGSVHYHGPLHHCRIVVYQGHFCDGKELGVYSEADELTCKQAFGGHSMRAACWK